MDSGVYSNPHPSKIKATIKNLNNTYDVSIYTNSEYTSNLLEDLKVEHRPIFDERYLYNRGSKQRQGHLSELEKIALGAANMQSQNK